MSALSRVTIPWDAEEFRRVKLAERLLIERRLGMLENVNGVIHRTVKAMATEDWGAQRELTHQDMPLYALIAYVTNRLTKDSFFSLLYFWAAGQQNGFVGVQTYTMEKRDESIFLHRLNLAKNNPDARKRLPQVVALMRQKPLIEQRFFLFPQKTFLEGLELEHEVGISPFTKMTVDGNKTMHVIPSFTLLQTYVEVKYAGKPPVKANPVIGRSSLEDIRQNGLKQERDIAFHFPGVALPEKADELSSPWHAFTTHDVYHWMRASAIPPSHQRVLIGVADLAGELQSQRKEAILSLDSNWSLVVGYDEEIWSLGKLRASLIDMDSYVYQNLENRHVPGYKQTIGLEAEDCFWHFFNDTVRLQVTAFATTSFVEEELMKNICRYLQTQPRDLLLHLPPETGFKALKKYNEYARHQPRFQETFFAPFRMKAIQDAWFSEHVNRAKNENGMPQLTLDNCLEIFDHAVTAKCTPLTQATMHYIKAELENLKKTEQFEQYRLGQPKRCATLLKRIAESNATAKK